jgi:DNA-directed RNA polymerase sigma subunit (sigma70/sigma32)
MSVGTRTQTLTRQKAIEKVRQCLDQLSTKEAQAIRLRYGVVEKEDVEVGAPADACSAETRSRLMEIEEKIFAKLRSLHSEPQPQEAKSKIIKALRRKH